MRLEPGPAGVLDEESFWRARGRPAAVVHLAGSRLVGAVGAAGDAARSPHSVAWASADGVTVGVALHQTLVFPRLAA